MDLARTYDREVLLARASAPPTYLPATEVYLPASDTAVTDQQEAERYLEVVATRVRDAGLRARPLILAGPPEAELMALLARESIGLVVMSTHGRTGAARMLLGSVARHLIYHATMPLIVLPPRYLATRGAPLDAQETPAR